MILVSTPAAAHVLKSLTQTFGNFPIYLTENNVGLLKVYEHGPLLSLMGQISALLRGYPKHDKLTVSFDGENILVEETPSAGIFGGARSTGNHEYNAARTADWRGLGLHLKNPA